ncbi:hypothetical protein K501DRAFT_334401 [Backusella circina FSU 941]|nr:hypothetical protein K501DRAFT_334401 [Backusella circina FSU 941]
MAMFMKNILSTVSRSGQQWTCNPQNYFRVTGSISFNDTDVHMVNGKKINHFKLGAIAKLSHCDNEVPLLQCSIKQDKSKTLEPVPIGKNTVDLKRLQFRIASENNARQRHVVIVSQLFAELDNGERIMIATCDSEPIVLRDENTGHYFDLSGEAKQNEKPASPPFLKTSVLPPMQDNSTGVDTTHTYTDRSGGLQLGEYVPSSSRQNHPPMNYYGNQGHSLHRPKLGFESQDNASNADQTNQSLVPSIYQPNQNYTPPLNRSKTYLQSKSTTSYLSYRNDLLENSKTGLSMNHNNSETLKKIQSDSQQDKGDKNMTQGRYPQQDEKIPSLSLPPKQRQRTLSLLSILLPPLPSTPPQIQKGSSQTSLLQQKQMVRSTQQQHNAVPAPSLPQQQPKRPRPYSYIAAAVALVSPRIHQLEKSKPSKPPKPLEKTQKVMQSEPTELSKRLKRSEESRRREISESLAPFDPSRSSEPSDQQHQLDLLEDIILPRRSKTSQSPPSEYSNGPF